MSPRRHTSAPFKKKRRDAKRTAQAPCQTTGSFPPWARKNGAEEEEKEAEKTFIAIDTEDEGENAVEGD